MSAEPSTNLTALANATVSVLLAGPDVVLPGFAWFFHFITYACVFGSVMCWAMQYTLYHSKQLKDSTCLVLMRGQLVSDGVLCSYGIFRWGYTLLLGLAGSNCTCSGFRARR